MKKMITAALAFVLAVGACLGLAGCKPRKERVVEEIFKASNAVNFTSKEEGRNHYQKKDVEMDGEYRDWRSEKGTRLVDIPGLAYAYKGESEHYFYEGSTLVDEIAPVEIYMFKHKDRFFKVTKNQGELFNEEPWAFVEYEDKEEFVGDYAPNAGLLGEIFTMQATLENVGVKAHAMRSMWEWNGKDNRWEIAMQTDLVQLGALSNDRGVVAYVKDTISGYWQEYTVTDVGDTVIEIPAEVTAAVDGYIAKLEEATE